jgi:hypothetical protein
MINSKHAGEFESIYKWDTMKEIGSHELKFKERTVPGKTLEVELTSGEKVHVWRADNGEDYFCHGLTFGGKEAPGGPISPLGEYVLTILHSYYELVVPESKAVADDVLVWRGTSANDVVHSTIITEPVLTPGKNQLDYTTRLQTKNGIQLETNMTLERLCEGYYGESYNCYRRRR